MHARPAPTAVLLLCPAMLLLVLLATTPTTAAAVNTTSTPCAPASCGNLTIAYPFWLAGTHPPECGYRAFEVACDDRGNVSLKNSYWKYQVMDIFYDNSSFVVTNANVQECCDLTLAGNATSDLGVGPFKISDRNHELFFLSDCGQGQARPPSWAPVNCTGYPPYDSPRSFAWLAGKYSPDDILKPLPGNCTVALMPVLGDQGAVVAADYDRLMKGGFLLEHSYTAEDCAACTESGGGKCSVDLNDDVLQCQCFDGNDWPFCGQYVTP